MNKNFTLSAFLLFTLSFIWQEAAYSQKLLADRKSVSGKKEINFNGQWKGAFNEMGNPAIAGMDDDIRYVLELTIDGSRVGGYSYTYFSGSFKKYYTICRLTGTLNRATNELIVTEIERVKYNTPPDFGNCFQTHKLRYEKDTGNMEVLRGTWIPAPNQGRGCGTGVTVLSRRVVQPLPIGFLPSKKPADVAATQKKPAPRHTAPATGRAVPPVKQSQPSSRPELPKSKINSDTGNDIASTAPPEMKSTHSITSPHANEFEHRRTNVLKTIKIEQPVFRLDFYDNGEIDGDSITVFYNGKVVLSHKRLSDKPISLTLSLDKNVKENVVTMYADNLGSIPPNTALMIVTDGNKRYEVRIESDTEKSGSVIFRHEDD